MSDSDSPSSRLLAGASLLLVEDDPSVRRAIGRMLELEGALLAEAGNGEQAIRILERDVEQLLDAVVTDLEMPVVSGHELIAVLEECRPDLPVVAMTGYTLPANFRAGVPLFYKPFSPEALVRQLHLVVRHSQETRRRAKQMRADAGDARTLASRQRAIAEQQRARSLDLMGTLERQRAIRKQS
jgi:two-component system, NtrC family, C4-dicarboxylate transport response regulator DctD